MMNSEFDHFFINATVYEDRVEEVHYISDPVRKVRRERSTRIWKVEQFLGRGGFGEVRLERNQEDGKVRAVKRIPITNTTLSYGECKKELEAMLEFSKPKYKEAAVFVDFFGWFKHRNDVFLAMEYVDLGDLYTNVFANSGKVPENEARDIGEQILFGLEIMHAERFAHRDLKPQNILVVSKSPRWWVKLADFGVSKRLIDTTNYTRVGTLSYMAPELLDLLDWYRPTSADTNAVDIWSVGCIIYQLITGVVPFPRGTSLMKYCENKSSFPSDPLTNSGIKSEGSRFLRQLLVAHPRERPSASQALKHDWILFDSNTTRNFPSLTVQPNLEEPELQPPNSSELDSTTRNSPWLTIRPILEKKPELQPSTSSELDYNAYNTKTHIGLQSNLSMQSTSSDSTAQILEPAFRVRHQLTSHNALVFCVAFAPDSKYIASGSTGNTVRLWDFASRIALHGFIGHSDWVHSVVFSPDGKLLASGSYDNTVRLWDIASRTALHVFTDHNSRVFSVAFSPDGKFIASGSWDHTVRLWDIASRTALHVFTGHNNRVFSVVFSPNGKFIASGSTDNTVRLWDIASRTALHVFTDHNSRVLSVAFSPDGKFIASGSWDHTVRLWDIASRTALHVFTGHNNQVRSVAFSPDSKFIVSGSIDKTVKLWDLASGEALQTLTGHTDDVSSVAFSLDGKFIASGSHDKTIRLWELK